MNVSALLYTLASVPMFAARPFLAAFVTALLARFGESIPWLSESAVIQALGGAPEWFQSTTVLAIFGVLALGEALAVKHSEVRAVMEDVDSILKSAVAMLVALALVDAESAETLRSIQRSGIGTESLWSIVVGALVFAASALRRSVLSFVSDIDDHDDLGVQSLLHWIESTWTVLGLMFIVLLPIAALVLSGLTALGLYVARRGAERRERMQMRPCAGCGTLIPPHATRCFACRRMVEAPRAVGVFGQPKQRAELDLATQRFDLTSRKRCPECATRIRKRAVQQTCPTCGTVTFASRVEFERYLDALRKRLPRTLLVCLGLSAIPLLGVVPGVVYYRLTVVSGLRGYTPPLSGCFARIVVRIVDWGLIALQPIPILGALVVPVMCLSTYLIYRRTLTHLATEGIRERALLQPGA
jgi:predicted RNA-binding Zn-ribbon protein involved in translation (DUF1610 family)